MSDACRTAATRIVVSPYPGLSTAAMPRRDEVRVWVIVLAESPVPPVELFECLTADERTRAERYKVAKARHEFVTGRGLLRQLLANSLGVAAAEVSIAYTGAGKPILADASCGIHFNVSHTDGLALIAVAHRPIGIDVERVREVANPEGLVDRFFSVAERDAYRELKENLRPAAFFRGWTCKEAVLKARGLSVTLLDEFDVEIHPEKPAAVLGARHPEVAAWEWELRTVNVGEGFAAALATTRE